MIIHHSVIIHKRHRPLLDKPKAFIFHPGQGRGYGGYSGPGFSSYGGNPGMTVVAHSVDSLPSLQSCNSVRYYCIN